MSHLFEMKATLTATISAVCADIKTRSKARMEESRRLKELRRERMFASAAAVPVKGTKGENDDEEEEEDDNIVEKVDELLRTYR